MALLSYHNWCTAGVNLPTVVSNISSLTPPSWAGALEPLAKCWRFTRPNIIQPGIFTLMGGSAFSLHYPVRVIALLATNLSSTADQAHLTLTVRSDGPTGTVLYTSSQLLTLPARRRRRHVTWLVPPYADGTPRWVNHVRVEVETTDGGQIEIGTCWCGPAIELPGCIPAYGWVDRSKVSETYAVRDVPVRLPIRRSISVRAQLAREPEIYPGPPPVINPLGGPHVPWSSNDLERWLYSADRRMLLLPQLGDAYRDRQCEVVRSTGPLGIRHQRGRRAHLELAGEED